MNTKYIKIETYDINRNGKTYEPNEECLTGSINFVPKNKQHVNQMLNGFTFGEVCSLKYHMEDLSKTFKIIFYPNTYDPTNPEQEQIDITEQIMPQVIEVLTGLLGPMDWRINTRYARGYEYKKMTQKAIDELERTAQIKIQEE